MKFSLLYCVNRRNKTLVVEFYLFPRLADFSDNLLANRKHLESQEEDIIKRFTGSFELNHLVNQPNNVDKVPLYF